MISNKLYIFVLIGLICFFNVIHCSEIQVSAESETESEVKLPPGLIRGNWANKDSPYQRIDVDKEETKSVTDVSFQFWVRFSTKDPKTILVKDLKVNKFFLAGVTEGKDWDQIGAKKDCLLHLSWQSMDQPNNQVLQTAATYTLKADTKAVITDPPFPEDIDSHWIFYYLGVSHTKSQLTLFTYGTLTNQLQFFFVNGVEHLQGDQRGPFAFTLGSTINNNYGFPGYFYDVRFDYKSAIILNRQDALKSLTKQSKLPPQMNPDTNYIQLVGDQELSSLEDDQFAENSQYFRRFYKYYGAEEYSIQGWFKFDGTVKTGEKILLFLVAGNEPGEIQAGSNEGDQNLLCYLYNGYVYFSYFNSFIGKPSLGVQENTVAYSQEQINKYFWVYMGYSSRSRRLTYYIRFETSEYTGLVKEAWMNTPKYFGVYLTRGPFLKKAWNGVVRNMYMRFGRGAYKSDIFNDNFINMKDMNCAILYSECQFTGNQHQICSAQNTLDPNFAVLSIYVPPAKKIKLFKQQQQQGLSVEFLQSQECLQNIDFQKTKPDILLQLGIRLLDGHEAEYLRNSKYQIHLQDHVTHTLSAPPEDENDSSNIKKEEEEKKGTQRKLINQAVL